MIDLATLRQSPDVVKKSQAARGESESLVDEVLAADTARRAAVAAFETVRAEQKSLGSLVAKASGDEKTELLAKTKVLADEVKTTEAAVREADAALDAKVLELSNVVDPAAPVGMEDDFVVLKEVGAKRDLPPKELLFATMLKSVNLLVQLTLNVVQKFQALVFTI